MPQKGKRRRSPDRQACYMTPEQKRQARIAANMQGCDLMEWIGQAAAREAQRIIAEDSLQKKGGDA